MDEHGAKAIGEVNDPVRSPVGGGFDDHVVKSCRHRRRPRFLVRERVGEGEEEGRAEEEFEGFLGTPRWGINSVLLRTVLT